MGTTPQQTDSHVATPLNRTRTAFISDFSQGTTISLSSKEKTVVEAYIASDGNLAEVTRQVNAKYKKNYRWQTIDYWIKTKPHIQMYIREEFKDLAYENSITKAKWIRWCTERALNPQKQHGISFLFMKLLGQALGFLEVGDSVFRAKNMQINVTQSNGNK